MFFTRYIELDTYSIKSFFERISIDKELQKYPNSQGLIKHYYERIQEEAHKAVGKIEVLEKPRETYERIHELNGGDFFKLRWDIPKMLDLTDKNRLPIHQLSVHELFQYVDRDNLNPQKVKEALHNKKPILVIDYEPLELYFAVDGNHRIMSRYLKNPHQDSPINGFVLPGKLHMEAMISDLDRTLYKVVTNLSWIWAYAAKGGSLFEMLDLYEV